MRINAYAKINIGLDVIGCRPDGYHEVRMIMQSIGLHDVLYVERTDTPGVRIATERDDLPAGEDNLIYKAAKLIMDEYDLPGGIDVRLDKNIPVAAGLAGGSTDAAATIIAVNELYGLGLSREELMNMAVRIGADVPFCIIGGCAIAEGIGEVLTPVDSKLNCRVLLAKPADSVSTRYVYEHLDSACICHPDTDAIAEGLREGDIEKVARNMGNVLENVTAPLVPAIGRIEDILEDCDGCVRTMMSGSGSTVFGLFYPEAPEEAIKTAYERVRESGYAAELYITGLYNGKETSWMN